MTVGIASVQPRMEQPQPLAPGLFRMCTLIPRRSIELAWWLRCPVGKVRVRPKSLFNAQRVSNTANNRAREAFVEEKLLRTMLANVNTEWRLLARQSGNEAKLSRMSELRSQRLALVSALFEIERENRRAG